MTRNPAHAPALAFARTSLRSQPDSRRRNVLRAPMACSELPRKADRFDAGIGTLDGIEQMSIHGTLCGIRYLRESPCIVRQGRFMQPSRGGGGRYTQVIASCGERRRARPPAAGTRRCPANGVHQQGEGVLDGLRAARRYFRLTPRVQIVAGGMCVHPVVDSAGSRPRPAPHGRCRRFPVARDLIRPVFNGFSVIR
ncbi:hypothetical protein AWB65_03270 [Caballeronia humi]|uniref:Uncharacterized protein n=1 Tax=Caballeronia humi TaxID=326474 RepID=A0A158HEQ1_9BURK|nr:hypothetical protein AWB65_03270 [Caballeronia humi]